MMRIYRVGERYRDKGRNYNTSDEDEFNSWLSHPIPEDESDLPYLKGMRALRNFSETQKTGEYATFILVSSDQDETYPDEIDLENGEIRYWGDAKYSVKRGTRSKDRFYGNRRLKPHFDTVKESGRDVAAPILFFERKESGYVTFDGVCVLKAVTPDRNRESTDDGVVWTPNYRYHLSVLDIPEISLEWIYNRATADSDAGAPDAWTEWKQSESADDTDPEISTETSTSGTPYSYESSGVRVSESFRNRVFELYDETCVLTEMRTRPLVTLSHIAPRSEAVEYAEDVTNVFLLNWTHHMAFDAGLFTIDTDLRIRVNPEFKTTDAHLLATLHERDGEKITLPEDCEFSTERIRERNEALDWQVDELNTI
ncbi:hypothetical protein AUR64_03925 [Haloprofundus marisrubri]|uniref:Restriction endonuclease n=1 Tax=Haloprofundus marisrubri TaxID=1514971 RepID=A0A0W1RFI7_9EURY|nr:HNH endonuclease [Haloprofundus marisrubri]KTG11412.1 hypothetical protein AUR64_03925 [Haloprofundus marisrubri]